MTQELVRTGLLVGGRYELVEWLGEGGMGEVWSARHRGTGVQVAVKFLKPEAMGDERKRRRFMREAEALMRLRHRNVVAIMDIGCLPDGPPYIVTEFISGESLQQYVSRLGRLTVAGTREILAEVAEALIASHAVGVVHRDLKPENIMLVCDAHGATQVKVLDFGIAKFLDGTDNLTQTGTNIGSPRFMSPNQARSQPPDPRDDVYAAGALGYFMLVGRPPFTAENLGDLMVEIVTLPSPSLNEPGEQPLVPPAVEETILKALAKAREDRQRSMAAFRVEVEAWPKEEEGRIKTTAESRLPSFSEQEDSDELSVEITIGEDAAAALAKEARGRFPPPPDESRLAPVNPQTPPARRRSADRDWLGTGQEPSLRLDPRDIPPNRRLTVTQERRRKAKIRWGFALAFAAAVLGVAVFRLWSTEAFGDAVQEYVGPLLDRIFGR
ncbi:serine/threonine protein kinase [Candidatus Uhrbacteria bacterium]|nr:serine/threonine protein kinase [Candidatus Uhrbacteria bacterium]